MTTSTNASPMTITTQKVHLVFLYHPQVDFTSSPIPNAILRRLSTLYGHPKNVFVGQIRYGQLNSTSSISGPVDLDTLLSPNSKLSSTSLVPTDEFIRNFTLQQNRPKEDENVSFLTDSWSDIRTVRNRAWNDELDKLVGLEEGSKEDMKNEDITCIADGLVAAVEMFNRFSMTTNPLARYLVHLIPDSSSKMDLRNDIFPHSNMDSTHDRWNWDRAATELGKMGAWPSTVILPDHGSSLAVLSVEAERLHRTISDNLPSSLPSISDAPSILGAIFRPATFAKAMLLSGYSDAAGTAARAAANANISSISRKRQRRQSIKGNQSIDSGVNGVTQLSLESTNNPATTLSDSTPRKSTSDAQAIQKVLFLQQQQQMMMRNVKILQQQEEDQGNNSSSPTRNRLLNQFREQLVAQQDALRSYQTKLNDGGLVPDLNSSLVALMSIDREATNKGIHLGGPSNMQALVQRHRQQQLIQQQKQQEQTSLQSMSGSTTAVGSLNASIAPASVSSNTVSVTGEGTVKAAASADATLAQQPAKRPGGQVFWAGAITWNMALPNKQRNHAATFVTAQCAPYTDQSSLLLPWPQKFSISEVQTVSLSTMQAYATKNSTPCIMFNPRLLPNTSGQQPGGPSGTAPSANQTNETMYMMLARMIDSKKGCAFVRLQGAPNAPNGAGIVIVPTAPASGGTARRLLGLVFKDAVPWHLFVPQTTSATAVTGSNVATLTGSTDPQASATPVRPSPASQAPPALFQQQQQQQAAPIAARPIQPQTPQQIQYSAAGGTPSQVTPSLGNLGALSAAQLAQQLPAWAINALGQQQLQKQAVNTSITSAPAQQQQQNQPQIGAAGLNFANNSGAGGNNTNNMAVLSNLFGGGDANRMNLDFTALASQLNIPINRPPQQQQPQQPQQTQPQTVNNGGQFPISLWSNNVTSTNPGNGQIPQTGTSANQSIGTTAINPNLFANLMGGANLMGNQTSVPVGSSVADLEALQRILGLNNN